MTNRNEPIAWSENLATGVVAIDEQHQILVNMLNLAAEQLTAHSCHLQVEEIIRDLMSYALYHFDTEEELMLAYSYPIEEREKHFQEHRQFSANIAEMQQGIAQGKVVSKDELLSFLGNWLTHHIMDTDRQLGKFLCSLNETSA